MLKKIKIALICLGLIGCFLAASSGVTMAAVCDLTGVLPTDANGQPVACTCPAGYAHPDDNSGKSIVNQCEFVKKAVDCPSGRVSQTDSTKCAALGNDCNGNSAETCLNNNPIVTNINNIIKFLSGLIGLTIIIVIIWGGIQYSMAGDNPQAITAARQRITNGLIALVAFIFTFAFLEWLIPGGIFK